MQNTVVDPEFQLILINYDKMAIISQLTDLLITQNGIFFIINNSQLVFHVSQSEMKLIWYLDTLRRQPKFPMNVHRQAAQPNKEMRPSICQNVCDFDETLTPIFILAEPENYLLKLIRIGSGFHERSYINFCFHAAVILTTFSLHCVKIVYNSASSKFRQT